MHTSSRRSPRARWASGARDVRAEHADPSQRISADVMQWQLQNAVDDEPFLDYDFPLEQMNGVNVTAAESIHRRAARCDAARRGKLRRARSGKSTCAWPRPSQRARRLAAARRAAAAVHLAGDDRADAALHLAAAGTRTRSSRRCATRWRRSRSFPPTRRDELVAAATAVVADEVYPAWRNGDRRRSKRNCRAPPTPPASRAFENGAELYA